MLFPFSFPFHFGGPPADVDADGCWIGYPTAFESKLLEPMATYALEQFRQRFLFMLTSTHDGVRSARVIFQMAFETEISAVLVKMIDVPEGVLESKVCERRRFLEIDRDVRLQRYLVGPMLNELAANPVIPVPYVELIERYVTTDYPRYRICALAAAVCLAKAVQ